MNLHAMQHIVDSAYCFPISDNKISIRFRCAKDDLERVYILYESKYDIGERHIKEEMSKQYSTELYDFYTINLELDDTRLAYVFYLYDGKNYYYFSEDGVTENYDFKIGFYNFFQYPYINKVDLMERVEWTENAIFYQIFVDRFNIGKEEKDKSYINCEWGDIPNPKTFAGGDLKGITKKIDYIKSLGVNTIYLTPIFKSISNHKYDISDYYNIDEHFGTNDDLKELVEVAHKNDMRIVLDAVFNHCSDDMEQFVDVVKNGKKSPYYDWFIIYGDKPDKKEMNYEMFAYCEYMPKFNTSNEAVQKFLIDIACHYIEKYNIDGWRLDVSDEVSHDFWRLFRKAVKKVNKNCVIIGENWHDASNYLRGDQYDSIMNYAFTKACLDYFANAKMNSNQMASKLNEILVRNNDVVNSMMLNLLDSHDTHRFFSEVKKDKENMFAAISLLFMFKGMPCVFYGTEFLTEGGFDPDCRRCMDWEGYNAGKYNDYIVEIQNLSALRSKYNLASAEIMVYAVSDVLVVKRFVDDGEVSLYINHSCEDAMVDGLQLKANSHCIIEKEKR